MKVRLDDDSKKSGLCSLKNTYEKFLNDFKLIQTWMISKVAFLPALKHLNAAVKKSNKLTAELLKREEQYGLNATGKAPIYTGVLSGAEFVAMNQRGVLPKDHVTPEHGEYTHRLHWYIILHNATDGFTKNPSAVFYNTPLELLKASTAKAYKPPQDGWPSPMLNVYETTTFSMWEALFDRRPQAEFYSLTADHISCPEMFTALLVTPNQGTRGNLFAYQELALKVPNKNTHFSLAPDVPELSNVITARYDKRTGEAQTQGGQWAAWYRRRKTKTLGENEGAGNESDSDSEDDYDFATIKNSKSKTVLVKI